jgi:S-adenosylmethionine:tRNA ribosyltransferase-isomerase
MTAVAELGTRPAAPALGPAPLDFELPPELEAASPPEARGLARDGVRLLLSRRGAERHEHARFRDLPALLAPGDALVINTSATLPASVSAARAEGTPVALHLSTRLPGGLWLVEVRRPHGAGSLPFTEARAGERLALPARGEADLLAPFPPDAAPTGSRLWLAALRLPAQPFDYLELHGQPIRYGHVDRDWPLACYQTVYATEPGSAEMPSAGRAFTAATITALAARGVEVVPLVLHAGVSSQEAGEPPHPEFYRVPVATARRLNAARAAGGRVVAVGTTVARALETAADASGRVHAAEGWTDLVIGPVRGVRAVDGLLTGWHPPRASHLALLEAVAGRPLLESAYREAIERRYLWHEFGDLHLLLP